MEKAVVSIDRIGASFVFRVKGTGAGIAVCL
jgi:hypothetical protein